MKIREQMFYLHGPWEQEFTRLPSKKTRRLRSYKVGLLTGLLLTVAVLIICSAQRSLSRFTGLSFKLLDECGP